MRAAATVLAVLGMAGVIAASSPARAEGGGYDRRDDRAYNERGRGDGWREHEGREHRRREFEARERAEREQELRRHERERAHRIAAPYGYAAPPPAYYAPQPFFAPPGRPIGFGVR